LHTTSSARGRMDSRPLSCNYGYIGLLPTPGGSTKGLSDDAGSIVTEDTYSNESHAERVKKQKTWHVPMSLKAKRTTNPIRAVMDKITSQKREPIPGKPQISLSLGDPTAFGNLQAPQVLNETMISLIRDAKSNGYGASMGLDDARAAVAQRFSTARCAYKSSDVIIASGCSGALEIVINGMVDEGDDILVPRPGFPLYQVLAESQGARVREYPLLADKGWQADLAQLESLVTPRTKAIVVNNPSNPCGSVFPREHLMSILAIAERHKLPIIADEIYGEMAFESSVGCRFHSLAQLSEHVPVITVGGLAKQFLVPGWRVGWLMLHDPVGALADVRVGFGRLTQLIVGASTLVQSAIAPVLCPLVGSPAAASLIAADKEYMATLEANARFTFDRLSRIPGLAPVCPQGAMYVMVKLNLTVLADIASDAEFVDMLLTEEAVFVLPGVCFGAPNFFRVVFSGPRETLADAYDRIETFCERHATKRDRNEPQAI